ncbi:MAG: hypothetical protein NZO58_10355, partial [Gemmataceae bacterium]|nr:hypothetical protein [Gemmataceae bacterium]
SDSQDARLLGMPVGELRHRLEQCKSKLLMVRSQRVWPGRDEKILTAWNGLMIGAFAQAAQVLENDRYLRAAMAAAEWVLTNLRGRDGRLRRTAVIGASAKLDAYLEDYAYLIDALVTLYEACFAPRWLARAVELTEVLIKEFWDDRDGGFYYTGKDHETLIARTKDPHDNATPSGNAVAVLALLRLAALTGRSEFYDKAERTLSLFGDLMRSSPSATGQMLMALDFYLGPVREFAVVGDPAADDMREALRLIRRRFEPNKVVCGRSDTFAAADSSLLPLLADRVAAEQVTTYICQRQTCQAPLVGLEALRQALSQH